MNLNLILKTLKNKSR